jgi:hypothetical protein
MQDSGKPEDAGTAEPEGARTEETQESISRRQGSKSPGKLGSLILRPSRKTKRVGKLKASSGGATGRSGARGQPRAQAPGAPKNERFGVTRISVAGIAGRCRNRGYTWNLCWEAQLEERSSGETRSRRNRGAEGRESRGNSTICRRQGRKMQRPGQPVMHREAHRAK